MINNKMRFVLIIVLTSIFGFNSFGSNQTLQKLKFIKIFERSIAGTVTDQKNKFIKNVKVNAINVLTKKRYKTKTNESGLFKFQDLPLGIYKIKFEGKSGFLPKTIENVEVGLNGGVFYNISLDAK